MPTMTPLTNDTFSTFVLAHRFVVIHFWAAWNGTDRVMHRLLDSEIPSLLRDSVMIARLDVDQLAHQELCRQHGVLVTPFLAFYRDGRLIRSVRSMKSHEVITEHFRELVYGTVA